MFFRKKQLDYEVIALYRYDQVNNVDKGEFEAFVSYLQKAYQLHFNFASFFTTDFDKDNVCTLSKALKEIEKIGWENLVVIDLYDTDLRKQKKTYSFTLAMVNNPSVIKILIPRASQFNITAFLREFKSIYKPDYGFNYYTDNREWATSYAYPRYYKLSRTDGISKLSKRDNEAFAHNHQEVKNGMFRDIYYSNILNDRHITKIVDGMELKSYIALKQLGQLTSIDEDLHLWQLDKIELNTARKLLL